MNPSPGIETMDQVQAGQPTQSPVNGPIQVDESAHPRRAAASHEVARSEPAIRMRDFNAYYGDLRALAGINLDIPARRITAFIGPSGCGKTTLLRWINRMNDAVPGARAEGTLTLGELDVLADKTDVVSLRRRVGMVFQKPNPFPKSIYDNVAFGPRLHFKLTPGELDELVEWALHKAALWGEVKDRLRRSALSLSGGQQQRLCIARAIAVGPEVLLMDEPASSLDPKSTDAIEELMKELRKEYTIAIVTHNMQQASRTSDLTAFLFEGNLVEMDLTEKIFSNPGQEQTQRYVTGRFG
jgi:phosphate transport system ATP-binding protein